MSLSASIIRTTIDHVPAAADAQRVVEIAALAVAADGNLDPEEIHVIRVLCTELTVNLRVIDEVLALGSREDRLDRLRTTCAALETDAAKRLAYKMTVLTSVADLAAQDEEFEFDLDVQEALGLDSAVAEALSNQVHETLSAEG